MIDFMEQMRNGFEDFIGSFPVVEKPKDFKPSGYEKITKGVTLGLEKTDTVIDDTFRREFESALRSEVVYELTSSLKKLGKEVSISEIDFENFLMEPELNGDSVKCLENHDCVVVDPVVLTLFQTAKNSKYQQNSPDGSFDIFHIRLVGQWVREDKATNVYLSPYRMESMIPLNKDDVIYDLRDVRPDGSGKYTLEYDVYFR